MGLKKYQFVHTPHHHFTQKDKDNFIEKNQYPDSKTRIPKININIIFDE